MADKLTTVTRKCLNCKKEIHPRLADVKRGWGKFCSKRCKAKEQEGRTHQFADIIKNSGEEIWPIN